MPPTKRFTGISRLIHSQRWGDVAKRLYAWYPRSQLLEAPPILYRYEYRLELGGPFFLPLKSVSEFRSIDPLRSVSGGMTDLRSNEVVSYQLRLYEPTQNHIQLAKNYFSRSAIDDYDMATIGGILGGLGRKLTRTDTDYSPFYELPPDIQTKLAYSLKEVEIVVCIQTTTSHRADALAGMVGSGLSHFDSHRNFLAWASDQTFPVVLSASEAAALWHLPSEDIQTLGVVWLKPEPAPPPRELIIAQTETSTGIVLGTNSYQSQTRTIRLDYADRITHVNIIGRTRLGKSTLMHNMIHQDIQSGKGVGVIDPHGDLIKDILACSIPDHRIDDVVLFDVTDTEYPVGLNLLTAPSNVVPEAAADSILAVIRKIFADQWNPTRMEDVMYATIISLLTHPQATLQDIPRLLSNAEFRYQVLNKVKDPVALDFWHDEFNAASERYQLEMARPINSRIRRFYRSPTMRRILCQPHSLDFRYLLNTGKIFLANVGGLAEVESETLGALLMSKMQMAAMSRGHLEPEKRKPFYLYVDEVQNFITTSLPTVFSEAAKFGLSLVVANQFLKQLEGRTLEAILGNVGTTIIFGVGPGDAHILGKFVSPHVTSDDLIKLGRGQTIVRMQLHGQALDAFSMMTQPPLPPHDHADTTIERVRYHSRQTYARPQVEIDIQLDHRNHRTPPNQNLDHSPAKATDKPASGGFLG